MMTDSRPLASIFRVSRFLLVLGLAGSILAGCAASTDQHSVKSTLHRPATVQIVDTYKDEIIWSKEVPPGQTLNYDFNDPGSTIEIMTNSGQWATQMSWSTDGPGQTDSGTVQLPGSPIMARTSYATSRTYEGPTTMPANGKPGAPLESDTPASSNYSSTDQNPDQANDESNDQAQANPADQTDQTQDNNNNPGQPLPGDEPAPDTQNNGG